MVSINLCVIAFISLMKFYFISVMFNVNSYLIVYLKSVLVIIFVFNEIIALFYKIIFFMRTLVVVFNHGEY